MRTIRRALVLACVLASGAAAAATEAGAGAGSDWLTWRAGDDVTNLASLQRGARNFMGYCLGCHSLKYERYSRLGIDLGLTAEELQQYLIPPGDKPADYILTTMPAGDAATWSARRPLICRSWRARAARITCINF